MQDGLHDAPGRHFSGIWNSDELSEEENIEDDTTVGDAEVEASIERTIGVFDAVMEMEDREVNRPPKIFLENGTHGAANPGEHEARGEGGEPASSSGIHRAVPGDMLPTTEEGLAILTNAIAEIADSGVARESDDDAWLEEDTETPEERYRRYFQSEQCEVSDPDEWVDTHSQFNAFEIESKGDNSWNNTWSTYPKNYAKISCRRSTTSFGRSDKVCDCSRT